VCGPSTEGGGYILLAPTLAWAFLESWRLRSPWWVRGLLLASTVAFTVGVLVCLAPRSSAWMAYGPHPLGGLFLLLAIGGDSIRRIVEPATKVVAPTPTIGYAVGAIYGSPHYKPRAPGLDRFPRLRSRLVGRKSRSRIG
jgi:hypothetical protein